MSTLISLNEAAANGIDRLRKPEWAQAEDHLKIDAIDGRLGPWVHLYAPFNLKCNGRDPVDVLVVIWGDPAEKEWLPYTGPLPDSDEYKAVQSRFGLSAA